MNEKIKNGNENLWRKAINAYKKTVEPKEVISNFFKYYFVKFGYLYHGFTNNRDKEVTWTTIFTLKNMSI